MGEDVGPDTYHVNPQSQIDAEWLHRQGYQPADGCQYYDYDQPKAEALMVRLAEIGAVHVRASPDLCHMLVQGSVSAGVLGFVLICDKTLPPNSLVDTLVDRYFGDRGRLMIRRTAEARRIGWT